MANLSRKPRFFLLSLCFLLGFSLAINQQAFGEDNKETKKDTSMTNDQPENSNQKTTTTASGLKYIDLVVGSGDVAKSGQQATVNYTGWLSDNGKKGEQFDSSIGRRPFTFSLGGGMVIKGWDEGVAGMKVGGKRRLIIPANLGYGERGAGSRIPPNSELIFDVELLKVE